MRLKLPNFNASRKRIFHGIKRAAIHRRFHLSTEKSEVSTCLSIPNRAHPAMARFRCMARKCQRGLVLDGEVKEIWIAQLIASRIAVLDAWKNR